MAQITVNLPDADFEKMKEAATRSGGLDKYFQDALGFALLVDEETKKNNNIIARRAPICLSTKGMRCWLRPDFRGNLFALRWHGCADFLYQPMLKFLAGL